MILRASTTIESKSSEAKPYRFRNREKQQQRLGFGDEIESSCLR